MIVNRKKLISLTNANASIIKIANRKLNDYLKSTQLEIEEEGNVCFCHLLNDETQTKLIVKLARLSVSDGDYDDMFAC